MTERKKQEGQVIHPRIPVLLHAAAKDYGRATNRSLNGAIVYLLRRGLVAEGFGDPTTKETDQ